MDKKEILNQFYKLFRHQLSIEDFELWIYNTSEIETEMGKTFYFTLLDVNYKDKFARTILENIIYSHIPFSYFEELNLKSLLRDTITESRNLIELLNIYYDEYCAGYSFLRYLAFSFFPFMDGSDKEKWPIVINRSKPKIKSEATRLLGFLESGEIQITGDHEYKDNRSFNDRIELHSVEKMYLSDSEIES